MPLNRGSSAKAISPNIRELSHALRAHGGKGGKPQSAATAHKRAVAASMRMARKSK